MFTNGKLVQIFEMRSPPDELEHLIVHKLYPLGFEYKKDLIILEEQLIYGVGDRITPLIKQPIPGSIEIEWLDSIISMNGNFVWWVEWWVLITWWNSAYNWNPLIAADKKSLNSEPSKH